LLSKLVKWTRVPSRRFLLAAVSVPAFIFPMLTGCNGDGKSAADPINVNAGQIVRPADAGLALDDPGAVRAFETADRFLSDWLFLHDTTRASQHITPDLRASLEALLNETEVEGSCVLRQIEGDSLDAQGVTVARYAIEGCQITPPEADPADAIDITVTVTDEAAWVTGVQFLH
jgi:hypothetical protein